MEKKNSLNENEMADTNLNKKTISTNLLWRFLERFGAYITSFIISVVLARIIDPSTYGTVALMTVFIAFLDVFVTGGFANSLIQDKTTTEKDFNTLFWFNIIFSLLLYVVLFFTSPLIATYYEKESLKWLIRVSGISLIINGVKNLQFAYVSKNLQFKKFFFATIGGTVVSGIIGIVLAVNGFGAWALVVQSVANHFIDSIILWFIIKWHPKFQFCFKLLVKHFSFGWKILLYKIIYNISNSIRQLAIGKKYSDSDLAFYNKGKSYPNIIGQNIYNSVNSVMYPVLARTQDNYKRFNEILYKSLELNIFIVLPMMVGFFCVSDSFSYILLGEKWIVCVPYVKIFCIVVFLNSIEAIISSGPLALGKSTATMVLGIVECLINIVLLIVAIPFGTIAIAYSMVASSAINCIIYFVYLHKLTRFSVFKLTARSFVSIVSSILMGIVVYSLLNLILPYYVIFILQIITGISFYFLLSKVFCNCSLPYCLSLLKDIIKKRN